jgi:hypothetical protein
MRLDKLITVLQEHRNKVGNVSIGIHHDKPYLIVGVTTIGIGCGDTKICLISTDLGDQILNAKFAETKARQAIEALKG